jgi:hypothetical protein
MCRWLRKEESVEKEFIEGFIYVFLLIGLVIETMEDIREKKIWIPIIIFELPVLLGFNYWIGKGGAMLWIASFGIGAAFYLVRLERVMHLFFA